MSFFLDEISIFIEHQTPLCVSIVERTIPNPTQHSHIPSFVPEMAEGDKIHSLQVVPSQPPYEVAVPTANPTPTPAPAPINDNLGFEPPFSPYHEWGVEIMHPTEFNAYFGENADGDSNYANANTEEVNLDDNYDQLSQLKVNKNVDKAWLKRKLHWNINKKQVKLLRNRGFQVAMCEESYKERKDGVFQYFLIKNCQKIPLRICHHLLLVLG